MSEKQSVVTARGNGHAQAADRSVFVELASEAFLNRRARGRFVGGAIFGEPAWDMLLALYITEVSPPRKAISCLAQMVGTSQTSAARWIDYLEHQRLVKREGGTQDPRAIFVSLTEEGRDSLDGYFAHTSTKAASH